MKKYLVDLSKDEKQRLEELTTRGKSGARKIRRARILLLADEGYIDKEIARALGAAVTTVERVRKRCVEEGLEDALSERPRPGAARAGAYLAAKGVRDIASGFFVFILIAFQAPHILGWIIVAATIIPIVDAVIVLTHKGSKATAYGVHGATAAVMLVTAGLLLTSPT